MKIRIFIILILSSLFIYAGNDNNEKLTGIWVGNLTIQGMQLRLVFNLELKENKLTGTLDSPDQGAKGIPLGEIISADDSITIQVPSVAGYYKGIIDFDQMKISGEWSQSGMSLPLDLIKTEKVEEVKRPQTPVEPFPYRVEEINFRNEKENIKLAGTLTIPEEMEKVPVVIMVTGSGPQDRDETVMNHKPFLVISDYFSRNGIAVLRYDDRGIGESEGIFSNATTADFADDVNSAVDFIKSRAEFKNSKIGIVGHSEGGIIAPMVSVNNSEINFIILLAAPALPGDEILRLQTRLIAKAEGAVDSVIERDLKFSDSIYEILKSETDTAIIAQEIRTRLRDYYNKLSEDEKQRAGDIDILLEQNLKQINTPWFRYFVNYDPRPVLEKLKIPVLALYGEKDLQVPAKENILQIEKALKENENNETRIIELQDLNHLFQHAKTGSPTEYAAIEETFSEKAMKIMVEWILK